MSDPKHPVWRLLAIALIGAIGLAYCEIAYANGVDVIKDGGLIALITAASSLATKYLGANP